MNSKSSKGESRRPERKRNPLGPGKKPSHTKPDARTIAMLVVERVLFDKAFAAAALNAEFARYPQLSSRERGFATELAYTTLRCRRALETELGKLTPRGLPKDRVVRAALLVGAAQSLFLDNASLPIAVDAAVTRVKALRDPKTSGFVNALLRRIGAGPKLDRAQALRMNVPEWLRKRLETCVGREEAEALVGVSPTAAALTHSTDVRLVKGHPVPDWLTEAPKGRFAPGARRLDKQGDLRSQQGYEAGDFVIQEEGAQLIAWALDVREGASVLDVCAGRGQKSTLLAERVGESGTVWASDLYESKLTALQAECARVGLTNIRTAAVDWSVGGGSLPTDFEFALVDAPCTGTGTLYKRPEIMDRLTESDPGRMGELAVQILRNVSKHCRTGASVVFAVCSVLPEECEGVVERVRDIFELGTFHSEPLRAALGANASSGRLLPLRHGTDGYFVASLRKR